MSYNIFNNFYFNSASHNIDFLQSDTPSSETVQTKKRVRDNLDEIEQPPLKIRHENFIQHAFNQPPDNINYYDNTCFGECNMKQLLPSPKTQEKTINTLKNHYKINVVWDRFSAKIASRLNDITLQNLKQEARAMADYANKNYKTHVAQIKNELTAKFKGADVSDKTVYGKIFALSLKVALLVTNPSYDVGLKFMTTYVSKKGITKHAPATRLFDAIPMLYNSTDSNNQIQRKALLIIEFLGSGSYNDVFLAYHQNLKSEIALRQLRTPISQIKVEADWRKEVQLHKWLEASGVSGITHLYESYCLDSPAPIERTMLLERCDDDCTAFIEQRTPLTDRDRISIFKQRITTLGQMHKLNVAHCDYKPNNIFYTIDDQKAIHTKIGDFGCAGWADKFLGGCHGTPSYKPFESFCLLPAKEDNTLCAKKGDAWAEGLVAYEIRYGEFDKHYAITQAMDNFVRTFYGHPEIKKFIALDSIPHPQGMPPTSQYSNRADLIRQFMKAYPESAGRLPNFFSETEKNNTILRENFLKYLHNTFLIAIFQQKHSAIFHTLRYDLTHGQHGHKGDMEDHIIASFLNPNIFQRLSIEDAPNYFNLLDINYT